MDNQDILLYKSAVVGETATNGGRMSNNQITSNVLNNIFLNVTNEQREDGAIKYRKVFFKNRNSANETGVNCRIWISKRSTGGNYYRLKAGTNIDIQTNAESYSDWLGTGYLSSPLSVDSTTFDVLFDTNNGVYDGNLVWLTDGSGGEEFLTIKASGGVSWVGNIATIITVSSARHSYPLGQNSLVAGVIELGNIIVSADSWTEASVSGTYDESTYPVEVNNVGTVEDDWEGIFKNATEFTVSGLHTGAIGSGSRNNDFSPVNTALGTGDYYFVLRSAGFGGTWALGDKFSFSTRHSAKGTWAKEVTPALTSAFTNNQFNLKIYVEGA